MSEILGLIVHQRSNTVCSMRRARVSFCGWCFRMAIAAAWSWSAFVTARAKASGWE